MSNEEKIAVPKNIATLATAARAQVWAYREGGSSAEWFKVKFGEGAWSPPFTSAEAIQFLKEEMKPLTETRSHGKSAGEPFLGPRPMHFETLEELRDAVTAFERIAREAGHTPDTVRFTDVFTLELMTQKLSDNSVVMDLRLRVKAAQ